MKKKNEIEFYIALWPDMGGEHDLIYCPADWSKIKIRNKFARRNKEWDFKSKKPIIAKVLQ